MITQPRTGTAMPGETNAMKASNRKLAGILLASSLLMSLPSPLATAQEMEVIAGGELEYQNHCAVCHGVDARGDGIMSKFLTLKPANLAQIAKKHDGQFPFWQVYRTIDGREEVRGHGVSQMPVWGPRFRAESGGNDPGAKSQAAGRILSLVFYLQHIQE
jgi:mono/diheme cytochrome c family protein